MERDELRTLMADYLDGLLDDGDARDAESVIAREPGLLADVARGRARLYRPYAVPAPPSDLEQRILQRHGRRPFLKLIRYAAVFVAGVVTTMILKLPAVESPEQDTEQARQPEAPAKVLRRRIR